MADLFNRDLVLRVGGLEIRTRDPGSTTVRPTLRVVFQIVRSLKKDPNSADVAIYNLAKENRTKLQEKNVNTVVEAGYIDNISQIFSGQLQRGTSVLDGADWITSMQSGDGVKQFKASRMSKSFAGPVAVEKILENVGKELGIGLGNLTEKVQEKGVRTALTEFSNGFVAKGKTEKIMHRVAQAMGYNFSIQDGQISLLGPTETINPDTIPLLSSGTGMIGSPEPGEKGIVKSRSLLQPDLTPGKRVKIEAEEVTGDFRIEKVIFSGDTWGLDWYSDLELKPL